MFQASWTKGKLVCPGCSSRLGGFDYVSGASEPVYIVKSKVDVKHAGSSLEMLRSEGSSSMVTPESASSSGGSQQGQQQQLTAL